MEPLDNEQRIKRAVYWAAKRTFMAFPSNAVFGFDDYSQINWLWVIENKPRYEALENDRLGKYVFCSLLYNAKRTFNKTRCYCIGENDKRIAAPASSRDYELIEKRRRALLEYVNRPNKRGYGSETTKLAAYVEMTLDNKRPCEIAAAFGKSTKEVLATLAHFTTRARAHFEKEGF